jgi:ABC-type dipeptide/oligopeptide/nickel transport system permease component
MRNSVFFFLFLFIVAFGNAGTILQDTIVPQTEREIQYDETENLNPPVFSKETIENYKKEKAFDYSEKPVTENWWTQFKNWIWELWLKFWNWLVGDFEAGSFTYFLVHMLPYFILLLILGFVIWLFYKLNPGATFFKSKEKPGVFFSEEEEIIKSKNIKKLIEKALENKDYRLAVRYYYLFILKKLTDAELINYEFDKTNSDYFAEITSENINSGFRKVTTLYDYIWYGSFAVTEEDFLKAQKTFTSLENQIPQTLD